VPEYHLRVDDRLDFVFRLTRMASDEAYQLEVGDELRIRSLTAPEVETDALVQPDGRIALPRLGPIAASGLTLVELQQSLNDAFQGAGIRDPQITVTPVQINTRLEELRATVDNRYGTGGQSRLVRVTPEGTIQLPAIGTVFVQGYTLPELKREIDLRYQEIVSGLEVTPILDERAPRFCYVVGEVRIPGRFELVAPTTIIQAISLAGGWNVGAKLEHVVVFRRDENWNLMATKVNLRPALFGKSPCPAGEIWLRDSDIVIVPKSCILTTTDAIDLIFTRGVYAVFPFSASLQLDRLNTLP
jgi:polysaccharide export outer membrane protein